MNNKCDDDDEIHTHVIKAPLRNSSISFAVALVDMTLMRLNFNPITITRINNLFILISISLFTLICTAHDKITTFSSYF